MAEYMSIYEIDAALLALVDEETGELMDYEAFEQLQMDRDTLVYNMRSWYLDTKTRMIGLKAEKQYIVKNLDDQIDALTRRSERIATYLEYATGGEKTKTDRYEISYRNSEATNVDDDFVTWAEVNAPDLLTYPDPKPNKTAIKQAIKDGMKVEHAVIEKNKSIIVK